MTTAKKYLERAEECAQLANRTKDHTLRADMLILRQKYLKTAERLHEVEQGKPNE